MFGLVWLLSQDKAALGKFAEKLQDDDNSGPISDLDKLKVTKEKVLYSFLVFLICRLHSHICQSNRTGAMLKVLAFSGHPRDGCAYELYKRSCNCCK